MSRDEYAELGQLMKSILLPEGVVLTYNDTAVTTRKPVRSFEVSLATYIADDEGVMRPTSRKTAVSIYEPLDGESASIYEMGIPVVETGDRWHYNVGQKVPQNLDRNNVTPSYLRKLRVAVLNHCHTILFEEDVNGDWVREAAADPHCLNEAVTTVFKLRHGDKVVAATPSDPESAKQAVARGFTVIYGSQISKGERENAKRAGLLPSSAELFPSPKPYSDDPDAPPVDVIPQEKWTQGMRLVANYVRMLGRKIMDGILIDVRMVRTQNSFLACYGGKHLDFNVLHLGHGWFAAGVTEAVDELIIHELGHEYASDHLSETYYEALCMLGAKLKRLALDEPGQFEKYKPKPASIETVVPA
jgi:hypothetical protein